MEWFNFQREASPRWRRRVWPTGRRGHSATLLEDGSHRVLIFGGHDDDHIYGDCFIFATHRSGRDLVCMDSFSYSSSCADEEEKKKNEEQEEEIQDFIVPLLTRCDSTIGFDQCSFSPPFEQNQASTSPSSPASPPSSSSTLHSFNVESLARSFHSATLVGDQLWIFGGQGFRSRPGGAGGGGTTTQVTAAAGTGAGQGQGHHAPVCCFDDFVVLDLVDLTWRKPAVLSERRPSPRKGHSMVRYRQTKLLLFGGTNGRRSFNDVWTFDTKKLKWKRKYLSYELLRKRIDDKVKEFMSQCTSKDSSSSSSPSSSSRSSSLPNIVISPTNENMEEALAAVLASTELEEFLPPSRFFHSAAMVAPSVMLIFGGRDELGVFDDCYLLDTNTMEWHRLKHLKGTPPSGRAGHTCSSLGDGKVYIFGGWDGSVEESTGQEIGALSDLHMLQLTFTHPFRSSLCCANVKAKWKKLGKDILGNPPPPRDCHAAVIFEQHSRTRLCIFGGSDEGFGYLSDLHILEITNKTPSLYHLTLRFIASNNTNNLRKWNESEEDEEEAGKKQTAFLPIELREVLRGEVAFYQEGAIVPRHLHRMKRLEKLHRELEELVTYSQLEEEEPSSSSVDSSLV
ncbi:hypothetical protein QOT17_018464 [Balamuthia mandrillaris]